MTHQYQKLGEILVARKVLSKDQLDAALAIQAETKRRLGEVLVEHCFVSEQVIAQCLAQQYGLEVIDAESVRPTQAALASMDIQEALHLRVLPISIDETEMFCLVSDPLDVPVTDRLVQKFHKRLRLAVSSETNLVNAIRHRYGVEAGPADIEVLLTLPPRFVDPHERGQFGESLCVDATDGFLMRPVTLIRTPLEKEESDRLLALTKTMASSRDRRFIRIYDSITHGRNRWTVCEPFGGECLEQVLRTRGAQAPTYSADIVKQIAEAAGTTSSKFAPAPWIDARNVWVSSEEVRFVPLAVNGMDPDELGWEVEATGNLFWYCLTGTPRKGLERDTSKFAVPPGMRRILDRCLSPKPKQRYESPAQIAADLATYKWLPNFSVNSPSASLDREELLATLTIVEGNTASQPWWARFGFKRAA